MPILSLSNQTVRYPCFCPEDRKFSRLIRFTNSSQQQFGLCNSGMAAGAWPFAFAYPLRGGRKSGEKHLKMDRPTAVVRLQLLLLPATAVFLCLPGGHEHCHNQQLQHASSEGIESLERSAKVSNRLSNLVQVASCIISQSMSLVVHPRWFGNTVNAMPKQGPMI